MPSIQGMRLGRFLVAAALLVGCASERDYYIGDEHFTAAQRAEIERANAWLAVQTGVPAVEIRWERLPDTGRERTIARADLSDGFCGDTGADGSIVIDSAQCGDRVGSTFAHELAHVLGLQHHAGAGLMFKSAPVALEWTADDLEDCQSQGVCR